MKNYTEEYQKLVLAQTAVKQMQLAVLEETEMPATVGTKTGLKLSGVITEVRDGTFKIDGTLCDTTEMQNIGVAKHYE